MKGRTFGFTAKSISDSLGIGKRTTFRLASPIPPESQKELEEFGEGTTEREKPKFWKDICSVMDAKAEPEKAYEGIRRLAESTCSFESLFPEALRNLIRGTFVRDYGVVPTGEAWVRCIYPHVLGIIHGDGDRSEFPEVRKDVPTTKWTGAEQREVESWMLRQGIMRLTLEQRGWLGRRLRRDLPKQHFRAPPVIFEGVLQNRVRERITRELGAKQPAEIKAEHDFYYEMGYVSSYELPLRRREITAQRTDRPARLSSIPELTLRGEERLDVNTLLSIIRPEDADIFRRYTLTDDEGRRTLASQLGLQPEHLRTKVSRICSQLRSNAKKISCVS